MSICTCRTLKPLNVQFHKTFGPIHTCIIQNMHQQETVTLIVGCPVERFWLMAFQPEKGYYLPCFQGKCSSWTASASNAYKSLTGQDVQNLILWRIIRVWRSESLPYLTNVIFKISITSEIKSKITLAQIHSYYNTRIKYFWLSQEEISCLVAQNEMTEEIYCYIPARPTDIEPSFQLLESELSSYDNGILIEIEKNAVIINFQNIQNQRDLLLAGYKLSEKDQVLLYNEYLNVTFPFVLMGIHAFKKLCFRIGIDPKEATHFLRAADCRNRGCINFKEVMHIIAATEPKAFHTGIGLEFRIKFVFRYYDRNSDGILEPNELSELLEAMSPSIQNDLSLARLITDINPDDQSFTLDMFEDYLTETKFNGFSNVLINNKSICESLMSLRKKAAAFATHPEQSVERILLDSYRSLPICKDDDKDKREYIIANNCIHVGKTGIIGLDNLSSITSAFYKSKEAKDFAQTQPSYLMYDDLQSCNVVLSTLKYFANEDQSTMKPVYCWSPEKFGDFTIALKDVCYKLIDIMKKEPRMVEVKSPVYILGDIHGNYHDLFTFEQYFWNLGINLSPVSVLFLGDYVDRGEFGVEVVGYLFAQKLQNNRRVFLLRGNHEIRDVQKNFTFYNECSKKFEGMAQQMWNAINNVFDCLPLAALVDDKIFCCHGGIPPPWLCPTINMINKIPCPLTKINEESALAWELVWNDPLKEGENVDMDTLDVQLSMNCGFAANSRRGTGHVFSYEALLDFMKINNLSYVIRAHESQYTGFQLQFKNKLLTVFSSSHYFRDNDAACILIQDRLLRIFRVNTNYVLPY